MLVWVVLFFVIALIAALLGFTNVAGAAVGVAQLLFLGFLIIAALLLITGRDGGLVD